MVFTMVTLRYPSNPAYFQTFLGYMGSLEDMIELYTNDMVAFGAPFLQTVLGYYNRREQGEKYNKNMGQFGVAHEK